MSELREEILRAGINKKRVIGVVLVAILLMSVFAYSVFFFSFLFGSQRPSPNEKYHDEYEDVLKVMPPLPLDILASLMDYFLQNPEDYLKFMDLLDPQDFADVINEMIDADIDDFDIGDFSQTLLAILGAAGALLLGEQEIFRVYDYGSLVDMQDVLWKYESFDQYNGSGWHSNAVPGVIDFIPLSEYYSQYSSLDILKIKMGINPNAGPTSMVLPSLFPYPYVMEDSFSAPNLVPGSPLLNKDNFNCSLIGLDFSSSDAVNLTFELFGENLPTEQDINGSAISLNLITGSAEYSSLLTQFTQLPPTVNDYINTNPYFKTHYNALDLLIGSNDNAYEIASIIKNYLQANFIFSWDAIMNDPAEDTEDVVEWFSEHGEGLFAEFTSAFVVFARAFRVPSRFVDGYRSVSMGQIDEVYDSQEGQNAILIKYKHLYNWAEIFIPTDITGNGYWIQFDIEPESASQGQFSLTINSNFSSGYRGGVANLTATLSSLESSVVNRTILFTDMLSGGTTIGQVLTDQNGQASILININNSQVVGPHPIVASFSTIASNTTAYVVYGDIEVNLLSVNPTLVNRSISNSTTIQGYVIDPIANQRVENATIEFVILDFGTNNKIANPFDTVYTNTDSNGNFNTITNVNPSVIRGNYEIRVDFNGSWSGVPLAFGVMSDSSSRIEFNVTEDASFDLLFTINGMPTDYPFVPVLGNLVNVKRSQQLNLSVTVLDEISKTPVAGENVEFYDFTKGDVLIASNFTDSNGLAWISYNIDNSHVSGPNLVYVKVSKNSNYSYYIVNESIQISSISFSNPLEIDIAGTGPTQFNVQCNLVDFFGNQIIYSDLDLRMNNSVLDYTAYLTPVNPVNPITPGSNSFNFNRGILPTTPLKNYTLLLEFNGNFDFSSYPYLATFNIPSLYNSTELARDLRVYDDNDVQIYLFINGSSTREVYDKFNPPWKDYLNNNFVNFSVNITHNNLAPLEDSDPPEYVTIWDDYTSIFPTLLDNHTFTSGNNGIHDFIIDTTSFYVGIHKIRVQFMNYPTINTTFIIINGTVSFNFNPVISEIQRDSIGFNVSGYVESGTGLRGLRVSLQIFNSFGVNSSQYILGSRTTTTDSDGYFQFDISSIDRDCPQGAYYIRIDFNGSIFLNEVPGINFIPNYMINTSSLLVPLNITAGTIIIQDGYHTKSGLAPTQWINTDVLYVYGNFTWDNITSPIANANLTVSIRWLNGTIIDINNTVETNALGQFNVTFVIDDQWPEYRSQTEIWVEFFPLQNKNFPYVEESSLKFS